jgi:hypothetical protein
MTKKMAERPRLESRLIIISLKTITHDKVIPENNRTLDYFGHH